MDGLTGERLDDASALYRADLARHRAAYRAARRLLRDPSPGDANDAVGATRRERPPDLVVDLGCGTGYGTRFLADGGRSVIGFDRVEPARRARGETTRFVQGELERLPFAEGSLAAVVSFQVIEHFADAEPYLGEITRVLAAGGVLLLTTPNRLTSDGENPFHLREYAPSELEAVLRRHFESVELRGIHAHGAAARFHAERLRQIRRITRLDPLGFRRRLPRRLVDWLFARLSLVVRLAARRARGGDAVVDDDFALGAGDDACLDLFAICRGRRARR